MYVFRKGTHGDNTQNNSIPKSKCQKKSQIHKHNKSHNALD